MKPRWEGATVDRCVFYFKLTSSMSIFISILKNINQSSNDFWFHEFFFFCDFCSNNFECFHEFLLIFCFLFSHCRYILISCHANYSRIYSGVNIGLMIGFVWFFSFGMMVPPLAEVWGKLGLDEQTFSCTILK